MSHTLLCGRLPWSSDEDDEDLQDLWESYKGTPRHEEGVPFDTTYCLAKIKNQPDDYDGGQRYCVGYTERGHDDYCRFHAKNLRHLDKLANMKHGVRALRESLKEDLSETEQQAYDEMVDVWADYYDLDPHADADTLEARAIETIREVRADKVLADEGMVKFRQAFTEEGAPKVDKNGEPIEEDEAHYMLSERRAIRNSIMKMDKQLGIDRRHRDKMSVEEDRNESLAGLSGHLNDAIEDEGQDFDPDDYDT